MSDVYNLICGAVSGAVSRTFTAPLELKITNAKSIYSKYNYT